jgi:hypothetical protein
LVVIAPSMRKPRLVALVAALVLAATPIVARTPKCTPRRKECRDPRSRCVANALATGCESGKPKKVHARGQAHVSRRDQELLRGPAAVVVSAPARAASSNAGWYERQIIGLKYGSGAAGPHRARSSVSRELR